MDNNNTSKPFGECRDCGIDLGGDYPADGSQYCEHCLPDWMRCADCGAEIGTHDHAAKAGAYATPCGERPNDA